MPRTIALILAVTLAMTLSLPAAGQPESRSPAEPAEQAPSAELFERDGTTNVHVRTKLADYIFSAKGGVLKSAYLYFSPIGMTPVELVPGTETEPDSGSRRLERSYAKGARFPFALTVKGEPTDEVTYDVSRERSDGELRLRFTAVVEGVRVTKTFTITENPYYTVDLNVTLENATNSSLDVPAQLSMGRGVGPAPNFRDQTKYLYEGEVEGEPRAGASAFRGLGAVGNGLVFFAHNISHDIPQGESGKLSPFESAPGDQQAFGLETSNLTLAPGESREFNAQVYAGRAKYTLLQHEGLEMLAPPGFFDQFIVPVVRLLHWIYGFTGNYGWAIILFTVITRVVLFPLTRKQFHSMAAMAELRPKMEKIQKRYPTMKRLKELHPNMSQEELMRRDRENRRALQQKMMELYREEGVNPLGGCLPMLIQLPILIVLWRSIIYSAETIHLSPGFLWIPDLSLHDPFYIIVAVTALMMILQTKTTPTMATTGQGPNQMVFMIFSVGIMILFLRNFPAGLWLYYFLTTVVQVGQQVFIRWEMDRIKSAKAVPAASGGSAGDSPEAAEAAPETEAQAASPNEEAASGSPEETKAKGKKKQTQKDADRGQQ